MTWDPGDIVAAIALALSIIATWMTWRFNRQQKGLIETQERLNRILLERESTDARSAKCADLGASFVKIGKSRRLKIFNKGKAPARNVRIEFPQGNLMIAKSDLAAKFPLEVLDVHQSVELLAAVHLRSEPKLQVKLLWADDSKESNEKVLFPTF